MHSIYTSVLVSVSIKIYGSSYLAYKQMTSDPIVSAFCLNPHGI